MTVFSAFGYLLLCGYQGGAGSHGYDCTGAETGLSNPMGCRTCHGSSATSSIALSIELDSAGTPTTNYVGGGTYTVTVTGTNTSTFSLPRYGFQLGCIEGSVAVVTPVNAGTWSSSLPTSTRIANPSAGNYVVRMVEHSSPCTPTSGTGSNGTIYSKTFTWTAPPAGTGTISFWSVLNAVNNNGSASSADKWNTAQLVVNELALPTAVTEQQATPALVVYPNPVQSDLNIHFALDISGSSTLRIYSTDGKVMTQHDVRPNCSSATEHLNTEGWSPGVYRVVLENEQGSKVVSIVKQ